MLRTEETANEVGDEPTEVQGEAGTEAMELQAGHVEADVAEDEAGTTTLTRLPQTTAKPPNWHPRHEKQS